MKNVLMIVTLVLVLVVAMGHTDEWISNKFEREGKIRNYIARVSHELKVFQSEAFLNEQCYPELHSMVDCIRASGSHERINLRSVVTPSEDIRHLGYIVANDLELYDEGPILICRTALGSMRAEKGEPRGEVHFAGLRLRKITPAEFKSLGGARKLSCHLVVAEMSALALTANKFRSEWNYELQPWPVTKLAS